MGRGYTLDKLFYGAVDAADDRDPRENFVAVTDHATNYDIASDQSCQPYGRKG